LRIIHCQIVNFGCLSNCSFDFDDGLNLLYAENGRGKSTFAAFIKAMLYGLPSVRKSDERRRFAPWQGGSFGGSLTFEADGTEYRLERFFGSKEREDRFALYQLATGNLSTRYTESIGEELFGVDADGFERSLYISQTNPFLAPDNNSIRARLGSLIEASDDLGSFEKADELLDTARRHYHVQGDRGYIAELSLSIHDKEEEIAAALAAGETAKRLSEEHADIEIKKKEISAALDEARIKRAEAEKRRLWDEQNAGYTALLEQRDAAKRQLVPLEEFFAPHLPTEEELYAAEAAASDCTTLSAQLQHAVLSDEDTRTLDALSQKYGGEVPSPAYMDKLRSALATLRLAKEKRRLAEARVSGDEDPIVARFENNLPTEGEIAALRAAGKALEEAQAALYVESPKKDAEQRLSLALLVGGGIFALLAVLGFVLSVLVLAIPCLIVALAALGVAAFGALLRQRKPSALAARLEELHVRQKRLAYLLSPFGYSDKDPLFALSRFFADLDRYFSILDDRAEAERVLRDAIAEEETKAEMLRTLLGVRVTGDPEETVAEIEAEIPVLRLLLQKKEELIHRREALSAEKERCSHVVASFLSHYASLSDLSPRAALDTVKKNLALSNQALAAHTLARNRVANYLQNTRFDPDAPPPPYSGDLRVLEENERKLGAALTELEALASVKENERVRMQEIALTLPTLQAERDALQEKKAEAEHTLSLILLTKDILKDAKEDLSTRYLRDMELHFDRYYQKITKDPALELPTDGSRISPFTMDTSLTLSFESYGERRPLTALSRGERDLALFCARLALIDAIFTSERPVLLLDDPFINLDDGNYAKATALLSALSERFQIVYTVCSQARLPAELPLKTL